MFLNCFSKNPKIWLEHGQLIMKHINIREKKDNNDHFASKIIYCKQKKKKEREQKRLR